MNDDFEITTDSKAYPSYQYSVFTRNGRDEQIVIRADNWDEFLEMKKNVNKILEKVQEKKEDPEWIENPNLAASYTCSICGKPAEYKEGVSKKTGKPWKATFCKENKEHVSWL